MPRLATAVAAAAVALLIHACVVNPVTGDSEFSLVSEAEELAIGEENFAPLQQTEGGGYTVDPQVQTYVAGVGARVAAVSDRRLPYEFVVLNNPEANAWALPGGKIAVNLGLLWEMNDEAELAAVLGHEVTHAAARHGARGQTQAILLQGTLLLGSLAVSGQEYADLLLGAAFLGATLIDSAYSREQELEADLYGTKYMHKAGYDPQGAVRLQETFVRLSRAEADNALTRLFASHPPSPERAERNRATAAALGAGGESRAEAYRARIARVRKARGAYEDFGTAQAALRKQQVERAATLGRQALAVEPREPRFHGLLGDVAFQRKEWSEAVRHYDRAIELDPHYYGPWLHRGLARFRLKQRDGARRDLQRSLELLPSTEAHLTLGRLDRAAGDVEDAIAHFRAASRADSALGKQARRELVRLDLPRNPGKYLQAEIEFDGDQPRVKLTNATPVTVRAVRVRVELDGKERIAAAPRVLKPRQTVRMPLAMPGLTADNASAARMTIVNVRLEDD